MHLAPVLLACLAPSAHASDVYREEDWVPLEGASFTMSDGRRAVRGSRYTGLEGRPHQVTLSPYAILRHEVTQGEFNGVMGFNPSYFADCGPTCPVEQVSWYDALRFANALSVREGRTPAYAFEGDRVYWRAEADGYRLPTEAEWEHAALGGRRRWRPGERATDKVGWTWRVADKRTHPVCTREPLPNGLCDTVGNVEEWVWDGYAQYPTAAQTDPRGPLGTAYRVVRGGSFHSSPYDPKARSRAAPAEPKKNLGFRLVRPGRR